MIRRLVATLAAWLFPRPLADAWEVVGLDAEAIDAHPRREELLAILRWSDVRHVMAPRECAIRGDLEEARADLVAMVKDSLVWQGRTPEDAAEWAVRAGATFVAKYTD